MVCRTDRRNEKEPRSTEERLDKPIERLMGKKSSTVEHDGGARQRNQPLAVERRERLTKACMVKSLDSPRPKLGRAPTDHAYLGDPDNSNHHLRSFISQLNKRHYKLDVPFVTNLHSHLESDHHHHKDDGQLVEAQTLSRRTNGPHKRLHLRRF